MHVTDPLVDVIRVAIRQIVGPTMPIQFITGHTHIRAYAQLDEHAASFEAGRFLDTIGFCSFPTKAFDDQQDGDDHDHDSTESSNSSVGNMGGSSNAMSLSQSTSSGKLNNDRKFHHVFIEPNQQYMSQLLIATHDAVGTKGGRSRPPSLDTSAGLILSKRIYETQEQLGLSTLVGCAPHDYELDLAMDQPDSLWGLYMYRAIPTILFNAQGRVDHNEINNSELSAALSGNNRTITPTFVQGTAAFRYKLFQGSVVLDDVIAVCPFNDMIYQFSTQLTGREFLSVLNVTSSYPNRVDPSLFASSGALPYLAVSTNERIDSNRHYTLFTSHFHVAEMTERLYRVLGKPISDPQPIQLADGPPGNFLTTTGVLKSFIELNWHCNANDLDRSPAGEEPHRRSHDTHEERPMAVIVFILILVVGLYIYQKRKEHMARSGYTPIGDPTTALWRSSNMTNSRS